MSKIIRKLLVGAGILVGLIVIAVIGVGLFFDVNHYKPQIQAAVEKSTGMTLEINGKASLKIIPRVRIALADVHLSSQGSAFFAAGEIQVTPRLLPFLLHREMIVDRVSLTSPKVHIEKSAAGRMNFETKTNKAATAPPAAQKKAAKPGAAPTQIHDVSIRDGELDFVDRGTGRRTQVSGITLDLSAISWGPGNDLIKNLTLHGSVEAGAIQTGKITVSNFKSDIQDNHGLIDLTRMKAGIYGGETQGSARLDLRGATPAMKVAQTATHLDLSQIMGNSGKIKAAGFAEASVNLSAAGKSKTALTRSADGTVLVHADNITLSNVNVDDLAGKLNGSEGMGLLSLGSGFLSGPAGSAAGQAAGAAGTVAENSVIRKLVSDWTIHQGIAHAKDVAFSTAKTTVAFQGNLNLADQTYQKFYVATVDSKGCAKNKVEVAGSLKHPRPTAASVGQQLAKVLPGQAGSVLSPNLGGLLGSQESKPKQEPSKDKSAACNQFYSGAAIS